MVEAMPRVVAACRQLSERLHELSGWVGANARDLGVSAEILKDGLDRALWEAEAVAQASRIGPQVAMVGAWQSPRFDLALAAVETEDGGMVRAADTGTIAVDLVRRLIPGDRDGGVTCALRLARDTAQPANAQYPFVARLLDKSDIALMIARTWLDSTPSASRRLPSSEAVREFFVDLPADMAPRTLPGLSIPDLARVRRHLSRHYPDAPEIAMLDACDYWRQMAALLPLMSENQRIEALSILWGQNPLLTELFDRLVAAIRQVAHADTILLPYDAIAVRDGDTGWLSEHKGNVLSCSAAAALAGVAGQSMRVWRPGGGIAAIGRSECAALVAELTLPVRGDWRFPGADCDLVAFPTPASALLTEVPEPGLDGTSSPAFSDAASTMGAFLQAKASYLFDLAAETSKITSLVAACVADGEIDARAATTIAVWIDQAMGETPQDRERVRNGLMIAACAEDIAQNAHDDLPGTSQAGRFAVEHVFAASPASALEWTPHRPFSAVYAIAPGDDGSTRQSLVASLLADAIDAASPAAKQQQLLLRLNRLRTQISAQFFRVHASNDPLRMIEWRRRTANVVSNRLEAGLTPDALIRLRRALTLGEQEVRNLLVAAGATGGPGTLTIPGHAALAQRCVAGWILKLARTTSSEVFAHAIGLSGLLLQSIAAEIAHGATRTNLAAALTDALQHADGHGPGAVERYAARISDMVNAFVDTLDQAPPAAIRAETTASVTRRNITIDLRGRTSDWCRAYRNLVEANLAAFSTPTAGSDKELGTILSAFSIPT